DDENYIPSYELALKRTRQQVIAAMTSSHKLTEQYWTIWSQQYLKSLRETHVLSFDKKRGTIIPPRMDTIVLIYESVLPRNTWRMGRIVKLQQSESGAIREAHVKLPNRRIIRRSVNLLIPLELGHTEQNETPTAGNNSKTTQNIDIKRENDLRQSSEHRYNLRPQSRTATVHSLQ
ncbi:hypothetical protein Angca_000034, partial [Angiostrongylus cantonensis]